MTKKILIAALLSFLLTGCLPKLGDDSGPRSESEFVKGQAVAGFPNIPRYEKAQILESIKDGDSYGASFIVEEELAKVVTFYTDYLPQLGWESIVTKKSETNYQFDVKNADYSGQIIVNSASDGKNVAISVYVEPR